MKLITGLVLWVGTVALLVVLLGHVYEDIKNTAQARGTCIAKYINLGVERRDIITHEGTCYVREHSK